MIGRIEFTSQPLVILMSIGIGLVLIVLILISVLLWVKYRRRMVGGHGRALLGTGGGGGSLRDPLTSTNSKEPLVLAVAGVETLSELREECTGSGSGETTG